MSATPSPALALSRAFDRFERSSARALDAVADVGDADLASALVNQDEAVTEVKAVVATVRFSDEMWRALLEIGKEPDDDKRRY